jgi:hypothetical protein
MEEEMTPDEIRKIAPSRFTHVEGFSAVLAQEALAQFAEFNLTLVGIQGALKSIAREIQNYSEDHE